MHLKSGPDPILCYSSSPSRQPWIITWYCGAAASSREVEPGRNLKRTYFSFLVTVALLCCSAFLCSIKWHNCTSACPKASDVIHEHLASTSSSTFASSHPPSWAYWASWDQPQNSPCHHVHCRPDSPATVTLPLPVRPRWFSDMVLSL